MSDDIFKRVTAEIVNMWENEGIPHVQRKNVQRKVVRLYKQYRDMNKTRTSKRDGAEFRMKTGKGHWDQLFDIALCRCKHLRRCDCPRGSRVPPEEIDFLRDQRGPRKMCLGGVDREGSARRRNAALRRERKQQAEGQKPPVATGGISASTVRANADCSNPGQFIHGDAGPSAAHDAEGDDDNVDGGSDISLTDDDRTCDDDWHAHSGEAALRGENTDVLTNTALAADRFRLSNRAAAAVINAFQLDIGRVTGEESELLVDPKKIWRERNRTRDESARVRAEQQSDGSLKALYFDGRHDETSAGPGAGRVQEDHVAVLAEPGSEYVSHFTPISGRAIDQVNELVNIAAAYNGDIRVLGCDGAAVNTGTSGGVCRLFELIEERPVHWFVCQIHSNELNLREVFRQLDGSTTGPKSFAGPLGKAASGNVRKLPVAKFRPVAGSVTEIPEAAAGELSDDQKLLYQLARAVQTGTIAPKVACRKIGPVNHARYAMFAASQ